MSETPWPAAFADILARHLPLAEGPVPGDAALSDLGLDSLGTVSLVMELEDSLDIAIPDELLVAETFHTAATLWAATSDLLARA
ncbi:phosphopantetheine-binding protein [Kutzneria buriramensis]|uniref:Acyl carrier protein n=1 Tax=Kutzneria buriramensis TaxID=1045776 RepID=A0A3E0H1P3_9PSEU|nr:phosphopantetheine-binding protein [Kutzneria buriramensis]REH35688.1 acyl carrier protein [Kutzneria buriramensis]